MKKVIGAHSAVTTSNAKQKSLRDRVDTIKYLVDPTYLLTQLGFTLDHETNKEIRCACLIHGGDNRTSFRFNVDKKTWVCFSHKCHEHYSNDMIGLVMAVNKCSFTDALIYLEELTGSRSVSRDSLFLYRQKREQEEFVKQSTPPSEERPTIVSDLCLKYYKPYRSNFFLEEGFSSEILDFFEVAGGYSDQDGLIRDIIPIRDHNNVLVAYSLRDIRRGTFKGLYSKYKLTTGFDKDSVLYNLNNAKMYADEKPLVIVEGFKSVWRIHDFGLPNVVACMGSGITTGQANLLCTYARKGVVFFFDNDYAGVSALGRSFDLLKDKMDIFVEIITETDEKGNGLDPADLTSEQLKFYLRNYK